MAHHMLYMCGTVTQVIFSYAKHFKSDIFSQQTMNLLPKVSGTNLDTVWFCHVFY